MSILSVKNLSKSFFVENKEIKILKNIFFEIEKGEFVVIKGSSGSGKSTLLSIIAGLDKPTKGKVFIEDKDITKLDEESMAIMRNLDIGFVFQSFYLIPSLTAFENVFFPLELSKNNDKKIALDLIKKVGVDLRKDNYPIQLSGGEKQRIAIARALVNKPKILFADEPTGNLDSKNSKNIIDLLIKLQKDYNLTLIIVTHEDKISKNASRVIEIKDGHIIKNQKNERIKSNI
jgi:putative ABC transport system ATP-binding protein